MTLISVIMPLYNAEQHLSETLDSYAENSFPDVELLVVDDGCEDRSLEILQAQQPSCTLLRQSNSGPACARNLALREARGLYVAFLDSDDLWPPNTLKSLLQALREDSQARIVQGKIETFADGPVAEKLKARLTPAPSYGVNIGSALFHREDLLAMGGFDEGLRFDEDTDLWIRCWERGLVKKLLPQVTLRYRLHQSNMTTQVKSNAKALLPLLKRHRDRMRGQPVRSSQGMAEYLGWKQAR